MLKLRLMACAASAVLLLAAGAAAAQNAPPIVEIPATILEPARTDARHEPLLGP